MSCWYVRPPRALGHIDVLLTHALDQAGYVERSYFSVPGGFALAMRLEQTSADGYPLSDAERWAVDVGPLRTLSLSRYLAALFGASPGHFRVVVLVPGAQWRHVLEPVCG